MSCISFDSYIKPQHGPSHRWRPYRCISFDSYIKPQPKSSVIIFFAVVYLLIPTSNHNSWIVTVTSTWLYIFWFLHQTTTTQPSRLCSMSCISFDSYIKPQPLYRFTIRAAVVYLLIPTSNHNPVAMICLSLPVVYLLIPTSNHNVGE